jgi:hypothetical protein
MKKGNCMKNRKKTTIIALMLMLAMIITSEAFVFAADGVDEESGSSDVQTVDQTTPEDTTADQGEPEVTEPEATDPEATDVTAPEEAVDEEGIDGDVEEESEEAAEAGETTDRTLEPPVAVDKVTAYPGYKSITLRWKTVEKVSSYLIMKSTKEDSGFENLKTIKAAELDNYIIKVDGEEYVNFRDAKGIKKNTKYYYRVYSRKVPTGGGDEVLSNDYAEASAKAVRPIYQTITFKTTIRLTAHDGSKVKHTFKKGQQVTAEGFGGGCYKFYYNNHLFYAYYTRIGKTTSNYMSKTNYTKVTAENFVNEYGRKKSSKSNYLIWVSTYTQHLYIFKWNKTQKKWKVYKDWECSTGKAASPSPTGFKEALNNNKMKSHSGIKWWSPYRSMNSIHGKRSSYKIDGAPHSHGCIRNYNEKGKWIYENCKPGTPLIVN